MGHLHLRKIYKDETMYKDKSAVKHKCDYTVRCLLKIIDYDKEIKYFNVLKCNQCLSFKSISEPGNIRGALLTDLTDEHRKLPLIVGRTRHYYNVVFKSLEDVTYND